VQAARKARSIKMPEFFAKYDPRNVAKVRVNGRDYDLNARDNHDLRGERHKFLMFGDGKAVISAMLASPNERLRDIVIDCLGCPLPSSVLDAWNAIHPLRNRGSHV